MPDLPPPSAFGKPNPSRPCLPTGYGIATGDEGMLPWRHVTEQMAQARNYWVATTRPDGRPHVVPVWGLWLDERFYFSTDAASRKGRNLAASPELVVHLESGDDVVILEGIAEIVTDAPFLARFADAYDAKYQVRLDFTDPAYRVYRLRLRVAWAWQEKDFPQTATRWRFGQAP